MTFGGLGPPETRKNRPWVPLFAIGGFEDEYLRKVYEKKMKDLESFEQRIDLAKESLNRRHKRIYVWHYDKPIPAYDSLSSIYDQMLTFKQLVNNFPLNYRYYVKKPH